MKPRRAVAAALVAAATVTAGGYAAADAWGSSPAGANALGPGLVTIHVDIHYSRFSLDHVRVAEGTLVRFVVRNRDPIHHEFIVGPPSVHAHHEVGHELAHPPVPGEVSLLPGETGVTIYRFTAPGPVEYACHLPGHFAYGMHGEIDVVPANADA